MTLILIYFVRKYDLDTILTSLLRFAFVPWDLATFINDSCVFEKHHISSRYQTK